MYEALGGDLVFDLGGMDTKFLIGSFVDSVAVSGGWADADAVAQEIGRYTGGQITFAAGSGGGGGGGLSTAQVQALVGQMVTGNAETGGVALTYNASTQKLDIVSGSARFDCAGAVGAG